jgi:hypothetical protein
MVAEGRRCDAKGIRDGGEPRRMTSVILLLKEGELSKYKKRYILPELGFDPSHRSTVVTGATN